MKNKIYKLISRANQVIIALTFTVFVSTAYSQTTYTFNYTGNTQTVNLTAGVYSVECWGGDGYTQTAGFNGKGGYASGIFTLTSAQIIYVNVGGLGSYPSGGVSANVWTFNGGGVGYPANNALYGNGGGASDVRTVGGTWDNPASLAGRVIVAGGGGAGRNSSYIGGHGGGLTGGTGTYFSPDQPGGPTGGSQTAGGSNTGYTSGLTQATLGLAMTWNGNALTANFLAGGGGGYYGGASGRVAGGGGSSYLGGVSSGTTIMFGQPGFVSNPVAASGNGFVIITRLCNINLGTTTGINSICQGAAVTLTTDAISNYTWSTGSNASSITVSPSVTTSYTLTATSPSLCVTSAAITITVSNAAPVLSVTASSNSVCLSNTVSISASGALTYTFSGGISNGVAFTPTATTTYTIVGQNGCGTNSSLTTISITPLPVVANISPTVVCAGNTATLSGGGASSYTWMPGSIVGTSVIVSPQQNTIYSVTGQAGNCNGTNTVALNVNPVPSLTVSASHFTLCLGESSTLTASGALNYTWQPGGSIGASVVVSPTLPIAYTVFGENSFGCIASVQQPVIVYPTPNLLVSNLNPTICPGSSIVLAASGANSYSWSTGANTNTVLVSPATTTTYTVVGTFTSTQCSSSKTIEVNVFISSLSVTAPTAVCVGSSATLQASGAGSYSWSTGASGNNIVVSPSIASVYTVTGFNTVGVYTCSSMANFQLQVNPLPVIGITASQTLICKGCTVALTASGATSYNWLFIGTSPTVIVLPLVNTIYTVQGTDLNGCTGTATINIRVSNCISPCGASIGEDSYVFTQLQISPNPSSGSFMIKGPGQVDLLLVNEIGQIVSSIELRQENNFKVEVRNIAPGIYFLRSKLPNINFVKKIVVDN